MQAIIERKPDFRFRDFVIEKTVELPAKRFEQMLRHPMDAQDFLLENASLMWKDGMGVYHCLLVTGKGRADGLLVDSEGYDYARYAAYVPETMALRYPSLSKMHQKLAAAVDFIIAVGVSQTTDCNWILSFHELKKKTGLSVGGEPYLQEVLGDMLSERPEVVDLIIEDGWINVDYYFDFCSNCVQNQTAEAFQPKEFRQTFRDLIHTPQEDIHLLHREIEIEPVTIAELSADTLTEAGKQKWADVLDANVCRIYSGAYGLQIELDGVYPARLQEFSEMLAGYYPATLYEKWVAQQEGTPAQSPEMKL